MFHQFAALVAMVTMGTALRLLKFFIMFPYYFFFERPVSYRGSVGAKNKIVPLQPASRNKTTAATTTFFVIKVTITIFGFFTWTGEVAEGVPSWCGAGPGFESSSSRAQRA